ncbi:MAG: sensor histidine kinase, partial [bacterium]
NADSSPVQVSLLENNGEVVVAVQDFGTGIPQQDLPYIFEPFYRVDKSRSKATGGYGLGMSLSKKIMEAHGGDIEISSRLKQGTTVYLKFRR